ncbi:CDP-glucose 4,6-dehydratase [Candidatus Pelagibacter ubique]|nr:CDP-glucose 4,6-dehydratase [Candidatus Pelagibacter ubique]
MNLNIYGDFFRNKRILITGNTGFVGAYLSLTLLMMGSKILGYALKKKDLRYISNTKEYKKKIKTIYDDISKISYHKSYIKRFKPQILIHLASQPILSRSYIESQATYETNVMGTVKLLELARELKSLKNILVFTSDKVYKNTQKKNLNENFSLGGDDPYSASKSAQDLIANSYKYSFFEKNKNIFIIRAGNIIGGGDWEKTRLIPDLFISSYKKKNILLRNPNATRPWQHILDVINGILKLISVKGGKISKKSLIYNIGPKSNKSIKVKDLILDFIKNSKIIKTKYKFQKLKFKEKKFLKLSSNAILKDISFNAKLNMDQTIKLTSDWYSMFFKNKANIFDFTKKEILSFFKSKY